MRARVPARLKLNFMTGSTLDVLSVQSVLLQQINEDTHFTKIKVYKIVSYLKIYLIGNTLLMTIIILLFYW